MDKISTRVWVTISHAFYGPEWVSGCHVCVCVPVWVCVCVCVCVLADNCVREEEAILTSTGACASGEVSTHEAT